jgi:hypothetical protein
VVVFTTTNWRINEARARAKFGPAQAAEYPEKKHHIAVSKETVWKWTIQGKLCEHDWLEARGEKVYSIAMIHDATSPHVTGRKLHNYRVRSYKLPNKGKSSGEFWRMPTTNS